MVKVGAVTDALRVVIDGRAEWLVDVELDFKDRYRGLQLIEVPRSAVHRLRDVLEDQVKVHFALRRKLPSLLQGCGT